MRHVVSDFLSIWNISLPFSEKTSFSIISKIFFVFSTWPKQKYHTTSLYDMVCYCGALQHTKQFYWRIFDEISRMISYTISNYAYSSGKSPWGVACVLCGIMTSSNVKIFRRYWPFVRGLQWSPVNSPHRGQWCRTLIFSLICALING